MQTSQNNRMRYEELGDSVHISVVNSNAYEYILNHTESTSNTQSDRRMNNLGIRGKIGYLSSCVWLTEHYFWNRQLAI